MEFPSIYMSLPIQTHKVWLSLCLLLVVPGNEQDILKLEFWTLHCCVEENFLFTTGPKSPLKTICSELCHLLFHFLPHFSCCLPLPEIDISSSRHFIPVHSPRQTVNLPRLWENTEPLLAFLSSIRKTENFFNSEKLKLFQIWKLKNSSILKIENKATE